MGVRSLDPIVDCAGFERSRLARADGLFLLVLRMDPAPGPAPTRRARFALWLWIGAFLASAGHVLTAWN